MEEELDPSLSEEIETHHVFHRRSRVPGTSYAFFLSSSIGAYRRVAAVGSAPTSSTRTSTAPPSLLLSSPAGAGLPL